jgi:hypothetical protein
VSLGTQKGGDKGGGPFLLGRHQVVSQHLQNAFFKGSHKDNAQPVLEVLQFHSEREARRESSNTEIGANCRTTHCHTVKSKSTKIIFLHFLCHSHTHMFGRSEHLAKESE